MKTDELTITQSPEVMGKVLDKIELIALYTGMARRKASNMRLMAEEMLSATKSIMEAYEGCLWMETSEENFSLHVRVEKPRGKAKREKLIALSKSGKATPTKGLFGRLSAALNELMLVDDENAPIVFSNHAMYTGGIVYPGAICIYHYLPPVNSSTDTKEEKVEDELAGIEKNIIDAIVNDITVTVNGDSIEITAVKNLK